MFVRVSEEFGGYDGDAVVAGGVVSCRGRRHGDIGSEESAVRRSFLPKLSGESEV